MRSSWQNKKAVKLGNAMNERWAGPFKVESMTAKGVSRLVDSEGLSKRSQMVNVRFAKCFAISSHMFVEQTRPKMSASLLMSRN